MTRFTVCIYCGSPWPDPASGLDHHADCAYVTNLWPVLPSDIGPHGFSCTRCPTAFAVGDHYVRVPLDGADRIFECVCLSCAAAAAVA